MLALCSSWGNQTEGKSHVQALARWPATKKVIKNLPRTGGQQKPPLMPLIAKQMSSSTPAAAAGPGDLKACSCAPTSAPQPNPIDPLQAEGQGSRIQAWSRAPSAGHGAAAGAGSPALLKERSIKRLLLA